MVDRMREANAIGSSNLLYTLVNHSTKQYLEMFRHFVRSIGAYTAWSDFDVLVICNAEAQKKIERMTEVKSLRNEGRFFFHRVPSDGSDLTRALLRKLDVVDALDHPVQPVDRVDASSVLEEIRFRKYQRVVFSDCDIVAQRDVWWLFSAVPANPPTAKTSGNKCVLYAPAEGEVDGDFWGKNLYQEDARVGGLKALKKSKKAVSFNAGTFAFHPTPTMLNVLRDLRCFALQKHAEQTRSGKRRYFYDQEFFNYYFNVLAAVRFPGTCSISTRELSRLVIIFPEHYGVPLCGKHYERAVFIHFAGIGRYEEKAELMDAYMQMLKGWRRICSAMQHWKGCPRG